MRTMEANRTLLAVNGLKHYGWDSHLSVRRDGQCRRDQDCSTSPPSSRTEVGVCHGGTNFFWLRSGELVLAIGRRLKKQVHVTV